MKSVKLKGYFTNFTHESLFPGFGKVLKYNCICGGKKIFGKSFSVSRGSCMMSDRLLQVSQHWLGQMTASLKIKQIC